MSCDAGWIPLACILLLSACGGDDPAGEDFTTQVRIGSPDLIVGEADGDSLVIGMIADVRQMADGTLLVADVANQAILHLDENGAPLARFGRGGEGPGEFSAPVQIAITSPSGYLVLDADRFELTRVEIGDDGTHRFVEHVPIPDQSLRLCASTSDVVLDTYRGEDALVRIGESGEVTSGYGDLSTVTDERFSGAELEALRIRAGLAFPVCTEEAVVLVPEWTPTVRAYSIDGQLRWETDLENHETLTFGRGADGRPEPEVTDRGWAHRVVTVVPAGENLLAVQLQAFGSSDDPNPDPHEIRLVRLNDGAQSTVSQSMPRIAAVRAGSVWTYANAPYPRLERRSFALILP